MSAGFLDFYADVTWTKSNVTRRVYSTTDGTLRLIPSAEPDERIIVRYTYQRTATKKDIRRHAMPDRASPSFPKPANRLPPSTRSLPSPWKPQLVRSSRGR